MTRKTRLQKLEASIPRRPDIESFHRDVHGKLMPRDGETYAETKAAHDAATKRGALVLEMVYVASTPEAVQ